MRRCPRPSSYGSALCLVGGQPMLALFLLAHFLYKKEGNLFICEPRKHLHDLEIHATSPGAACSFLHCVFKELWVLRPPARNFKPSRSPLRAVLPLLPSPPPPLGKQTRSSSSAPRPQPLAPAWCNSPSDSSTALSIGCPLIINALMPLHYIVGFENLKYG